MTNCSSLSCNRRNWWGQNGSCSNTCGCTASDGTPACNPCAPWGVSNSCSCGRCGTCANNGCGNWGCGNSWGCGNWGCANNWGCNNNWGCGTVSGSTCSVCGNSPCTCGGCNGCGGCTGASGFLVPRYQSIGRTFQRRITQTLCIDDIPDCAETPLTLVGVSVSGQATWEQLTDCRQPLLRVTVPVVVQIRDCAGRCRTGHATVTLTIPLCGCANQDLWRGQLHVAPCIRLAAPVTENEDGCFDATLEVQAEVFLVRLTGCSN